MLVDDIPGSYEVSPGYILCLHHLISIRASVRVLNTSLFRSSSLNFPLNDSTYPFSQGLPGSMNMAFTPRLDNHPLTALEVNSGPLSERMCSGTP